MRTIFMRALSKVEQSQCTLFATETMENHYFIMLSDKIRDNPVKF